MRTITNKPDLQNRTWKTFKITFEDFVSSVPGSVCLRLNWSSTIIIAITHCSILCRRWLKGREAGSCRCVALVVKATVSVFLLWCGGSCHLLHSQMLLSGAGGLIAKIFVGICVIFFLCFSRFEYMYVVSVGHMSPELMIQRHNFSVVIVLQWYHQIYLNLLNTLQ